MLRCKRLIILLAVRDARSASGKRTRRARGGTTPRPVLCRCGRLRLTRCDNARVSPGVQLTTAISIIMTFS